MPRARLRGRVTALALLTQCGVGRRGTRLGVSRTPRRPDLPLGERVRARPKPATTKETGGAQSVLVSLPAHRLANGSGRCGATPAGVSRTVRRSDLPTGGARKRPAGSVIDWRTAAPLRGETVPTTDISIQAFGIPMQASLVDLQLDSFGNSRGTQSLGDQATTMTGMATVCGWVGRYTGYIGGVLCGANAVSIIINSQRAYNAGKCEELLIGPGVIGSLAYSGGYCK